MTTKNKPQAIFDWRITHFEYGDRYTLMGWVNIRSADELPFEYINHPGARFWASGDDRIILKGCDISSCYAGYGRPNAPTHLRTGLNRGTRMEKPEYDIIISHLRTAGENLRIIDQTIKENSERITMEV